MPTPIVYPRPSAEAIARAQSKHRKSGDWWMIPCPVHKGDGLNCKIKDGEKWLVARCWSKDCDYYDILTALGVPHPKGQRPTSDFKIAEYQNSDGNPREVYRKDNPGGCLLYTSPSPRDRQKSRMPSSA